MPVSSPGVTTANAKRTGKDQGKITVSYRDASGHTTDATVVGSGQVVPAAPTVAVQGTPGSTTYSYRISAVDVTGTETGPSVAGTTALGNAVLTGANFNRVTWVAIPGAVTYNVYGRTAAGELKMTPTPISALQFDDTGAVTPSGALPALPAASTLNLFLPHRGGGKKVKLAVPLATGMKQVNVYFNR